MKIRHLLVSLLALVGMSMAGAAPALGDASSAPVGTDAAVLHGSLALSEYTSCAIMTTGTVKCWGSDTMGGELGNGDPTADSNVPVDVTGLSGVTAIAAGNWHMCALRTDGTVSCWGRGANGALGDGTTNNRTSPVAVTGLSGVTAISGGYMHTCALLEGGTVKCWGRNYSGQLGLGTTSLYEAAPGAAVSGLSGVVAIASAWDYNCALINDGTVKCWGSNGSGQLGNGSSGMGINELAPVAVSGLSGVVAIAAGNRHACALLDDATVKCWGYNGDGQLGTGSMTNSPTPVAVPGLSGVVSIDAGNGSTCALLNDGTMKCWGGDGDYEFGVSLGYGITVPTEIPNVSNIVAFDTGDYHTCVITASGGVRCFGANWNGQLGNLNSCNCSEDVADVFGLSSGIGATTTTTSSVPGGDGDGGGDTLPETGDGTTGTLVWILSLMSVGALLTAARRRFA